MFLKDTLQGYTVSSPLSPVNQVSAFLLLQSCILLFSFVIPWNFSCFLSMSVIWTFKMCFHLLAAFLLFLNPAISSFFSVYSFEASYLGRLSILSIFSHIACLRVCVCVCVCERERERERNVLLPQRSENWLVSPLSWNLKFEYLFS